MNNPMHRLPTREEEIAFLTVESVLGVEIMLADVGAGDSMPDGWWKLGSQTAYMEVTSPPAVDVMRRRAEAARDKKVFMESGSAPAHLGKLAGHLSAVVGDELSQDVEKLNARVADERHLFLLPRTCPDNQYFARLSDTYLDCDPEYVDNLALPDGLTDVWFTGRSQRGSDLADGFLSRVARFNRREGWTRHEVRVDERALPGPGPPIVEDPMPDGWRQPRFRSRVPSVIGEGVVEPV